MSNNIWKGFPQYYEYDFFRDNVLPNHFDYVSKSAYTYNWTYYLSYAYDNDVTKPLSYSINGTIFSGTPEDGLPFEISNGSVNGNKVITFTCPVPHGLSVGESVLLSFPYKKTYTFEVFSLGNDSYDSQAYVFNIYDVGYTGFTFYNTRKGFFKRVINPENPKETTSKYYVKKHKILTNLEDTIITKTAFENNAFPEKMKYEFSSLTPNLVSRVSQRNNSTSYTASYSKDIDLGNLLDNQKRPITEIFFTIINKGYSGYFNYPNFGIGLKQGWVLNLTSTTNYWWDDSNVDANTAIPTNSYTKTIGNTGYTFYYNENLKEGDIMDGDFCEWNDYTQTERIISPYIHKLKFNQNIFTTQGVPNTNADGYYYSPYHKMTIRNFANVIETGSVSNVDQVPRWAYFSEYDQEFRWRDLYTYGYVDETGRGVDYPFLNKAHYPFENITFRLIPEGTNINDVTAGVDVPYKPIVDDCE
jgi:hypothetical protein